MLKGLIARFRRVLAGAALCAAVALPVLTPSPAEAWWGPGWHAGWGWRGGVAIGLPPVVVGAPVYAPPPAYYPYAPAYAYAPPYWRWVPAYRAANGVFVGGHWEH